MLFLAARDIWEAFFGGGARKEQKKLFSFNLIFHHQATRQNADENLNYFIPDADYFLCRFWWRVEEAKRFVETESSVTITDEEHHQLIPSIYFEWNASWYRWLSFQAVVANFRRVCLRCIGDRISLGPYCSALSRMAGFTGTGKKKTSVLVFPSQLARGKNVEIAKKGNLLLSV